MDSSVRHTMKTMKPQLYIVTYSNQKMNEIDRKILKLQIRSMTRYQ